MPINNLNIVTSIEDYKNHIYIGLTGGSDFVLISDGQSGTSFKKLFDSKVQKPITSIKKVGDLLYVGTKENSTFYSIDGKKFNYLKGSSIVNQVNTINLLGDKIYIAGYKGLCYNFI